MKKTMFLTLMMLFMLLAANIVVFAEEISDNESSVLDKLKNEEMQKNTSTGVNTSTEVLENSDGDESGSEKLSANGNSTSGSSNLTESQSGNSSNNTGLSGLPVVGKLFRVTSKFGWRIHPVKKVRKLHTGIDVGVPKGTKLFALGNGVVSSAKWENGYGYTVIVKHVVGAKTLFVRYAHLSKMAKVGTEVKKGEQIPGALTGNSGIGTGAHLHIEVRESDPYGEALDPLKFMTAE